MLKLFEMEAMESTAGNCSIGNGECIDEKGIINSKALYS
jgi:hypothetical protein